MMKRFHRIGILLAILYFPAAALGLPEACAAWGRPDFGEVLQHAINPCVWAVWYVTLALGALYLAPWLLLIFMLPVYLLVFSWLDRPTLIKAMIILAVSPLVNPFQNVLPITQFLLHSIVH